MEYALRHKKEAVLPRSVVVVSILVLMEYALRHFAGAEQKSSFGLNPCFNGICSATANKRRQASVPKLGVSILVLMEYALRLLSSTDGKHKRYVSILVLMEYALRQGLYHDVLLLRGCLNPCFNGICSATCYHVRLPWLWFCLNPCFNGICSATSLLRASPPNCRTWSQSLF